jgi:hypothetical protein
MVANPMAPARQAHRLPDVALPKLAAGVSAVAVHPRNPMNVTRLAARVRTSTCEKVFVKDDTSRFSPNCEQLAALSAWERSPVDSRSSLTGVAHASGRVRTCPATIACAPSTRPDAPGALGSARQGCVRGPATLTRRHRWAGLGPSAFSHKRGARRWLLRRKTTLPIERDDNRFGARDCRQPSSFLRAASTRPFLRG